ncbi:OmpA family protein, partial [bacterium]|nr:OmpA family protein [bacterium]
SGGGQQNLEISSARTQTVKNFLIQQGIAPERINAVGLGAVDFINRSNPQAPENRRIEVGILKK